MVQKPKAMHFHEPVTVQFVQFRQGVMETDASGGEVFTGMIDGFFGVPPDGMQFDAYVKLSVGASFVDDAYEVMVAPALAQLGAHPEFRRLAYEYLNQCMSGMLGPHWGRMPGLTASNNLMQMPGRAVTLDFDGGSTTW